VRLDDTPGFGGGAVAAGAGCQGAGQAAGRGHVCRGCRRRFVCVTHVRVSMTYLFVVY
jgi:hypothetical protein